MTVERQAIYTIEYTGNFREESALDDVGPYKILVHAGSLDQATEEAKDILKELIRIKRSIRGEDAVLYYSLVSVSLHELYTLEVVE